MAHITDADAHVNLFFTNPGNSSTTGLAWTGTACEAKFVYRAAIIVPFFATDVQNAQVGFMSTRANKLCVPKTIKYQKSNRLLHMKWGTSWEWAMTFWGIEQHARAGELAQILIQLWIMTRYMFLLH
jgi:hypothetical protein